MLDTLAERERLTAAALLGGWLALLLGVAACVWMASELVWTALPGEPADAGATGVGTRPQAGPAAAGQTDLRQLHLFGQAGAMVAPQVIEAPETTLDLTLQGTLATEDPGSGLAIISDDQGREAYYGVGDDLPGSARLHEIHADRVILVRQGQYETLSLREQGQAINQPRRGTPTVARNATAPPQRSITPGIRGVDWQSVQQQYRVDPAQLAQQIRAIPITENGKPIGVRLQAGRNAALMQRLGLRSTDIITSVNGISLDDPSKTFELMNKLQNETRFNVELRRDGRSQTLTIDLNQ